MVMVVEKKQRRTWGAIKQLTFVFLQLIIRIFVLKNDYLGPRTRKETQVRGWACHNMYQLGEMRALRLDERYGVFSHWWTHRGNIECMCLDFCLWRSVPPRILPADKLATPWYCRPLDHRTTSLLHRVCVLEFLSWHAEREQQNYGFRAISNNVAA